MPAFRVSSVHGAAASRVQPGEDQNVAAQHGQSIREAFAASAPAAAGQALAGRSQRLFEPEVGLHGHAVDYRVDFERSLPQWRLAWQVGRGEASGGAYPDRA